MDDAPSSEPAFSPPRIVLGSDNYHLSRAMKQSLHEAGFTVDLAYDYIHLESLWQQHHHEIVLIEVAYHHSIEPAVHTALRLKQQDASQFVGYLADAVLANSGLTGDAVFPRDARHLPEALRHHLPALPR